MKRKNIKNKVIVIFFLLLLSFASFVFAAPQQLKVVGKQIQTEAGCNFRIVGVNICGLEWSANGMGPPSGNGGDIRLSITNAVNVWKANVVRIPMNQDFWFGYSDGNSQSSTTQNTTYMNNYRAIIDGAITTASNLGCYVELDLHWSGNGNWGSTIPSGQQDMPDDHSVNFWQDVAARYANNPAVIFNLYNEPKGTLSWSLWRNGGNVAAGWHTPGHQALVTAIRGTGANNMIVAGGINWAWDMTGIAANALTDTGSGNGIAYEAHIYDNKGGTTQAQKINLWNTNVTVAVAAGYCVIIGEFGPVTDGTQDNAGCTPFESDLISWINGNNPQSYVYNAMGWCWHQGASPKLIKDWSFTPTDCHGLQVKNWLAAVVPPSCPAGSPTRTGTRTPVYSPTITPTSTAIPPYDIIYDGDTTGHQISDGTIINGGTGVMTQTTGGNAGNGMRLAYSNPGYWQELRWDLTTNKNIGANNYFTFDVRLDAGAIGGLSLRLNWTVTLDTASYLVEGGAINGTWKTMRIPLTALTEAGQTQVDFINFINTSNNGYTLMIDNIRLEGAAPSPTRTPVITATFTRTSTGTSTRTRTQTPLNTNTFTRTVTLTPVNTSTFTRTVTLTPVNTSTFTRTVTLTAVNTNTFTSTMTVTAVNTGTASNTPVNTYTGTPGNTFTFTVTRTLSPANTATLTSTATFTFTRTNTPVNTFTYTSTLTSTTVIFTPTITMTVIYTPSCPLLWSDEFDGAAVDTSKWVFETGAGGWGNNELEYYTGRTENARVESGSLVIEARAESYGGSNYTSARMKTQGRYSNKYGRIEARMKLPYGQGIWPAFWMLGDSISTVGWPACGEIDIMEMIGGGENRDDTTYGTAHWDSGGHAMYGGSTELPDPRVFAEEYHIFGIEWDATQIRWFLDGVQFHVIDITPADLSELQENAFILLNLAVGGNWPGVPDGTTVFPQKMYVDYVRWYGCALPTSTPTFTRTPVNTATRTMTATLTATNSRTSTFTPVNTATPSRTVTMTASVTITQADTFTITQTPTGTPPTYTVTATSTVTLVSTQTNTAVNTATLSYTTTTTRTFTPTRTQTPSSTRTAVNTATRTTTPSFTPTRTSTLVSTAISTLTITPTNTPVPTATIAWGERFEIPNTLIYPNPYNPDNNDLKINISITQAAAEMKIRIYTVGYRRIMEIACGALNEKEVTVTIPGARISRLSAGTYYMIAEGKSTGGQKTRSKPKTLVILK